jgi:hypothetical protein
MQETIPYRPEMITSNAPASYDEMQQRKRRSSAKAKHLGEQESQSPCDHCCNRQECATGKLACFMLLRWMDKMHGQYKPKRRYYDLLFPEG